MSSTCPRNIRPNIARVYCSSHHKVSCESTRQTDRLCGDALLTAAGLAIDSGGGYLIIFIIVLVSLVLAGGDPETGLAVTEGLVLAGKVVALTGVAGCATLGESARASGELGADGSVLLDPVGESILAVLDDGLGGLVAVVGLAGLAGSDRGVVDELEEVLAVAGNDGHLLAVLTESVELVSESSLQLLTSDVGELSLSDERLGLGTDKLLLKNNNLGAVGLLVLELSDLVGDLLLACGNCKCVFQLLKEVVSAYGLCWAGRKPQCCECS